MIHLTVVSPPQEQARNVFFFYFLYFSGGWSMCARGRIRMCKARLFLFFFSKPRITFNFFKYNLNRNFRFLFVKKKKRIAPCRRRQGIFYHEMWAWQVKKGWSECVCLRVCVCWPLTSCWWSCDCSHARPVYENRCECGTCSTITAGQSVKPPSCRTQKRHEIRRHQKFASNSTQRSSSPSSSDSPVTC